LFAAVREIERVAARAWPALQNEDLAGWRLRYSYGVTRRANSVWPNAWDEGGGTLADRIGQVEAFYTARGLPARYQICPAALPTELDAVMAARDYAAVAETAVMTAPIDVVTGALAQAGCWQVALTTAVDDHWMALYAAVEQVPEREIAVRRAILESIAHPAAYVTVWAGDEAVAAGSAVCTGAFAGLFNIGTRPAWRRRGAAQTALAALLQWGADLGAQTTYLQVMVQNVPARALYARLGYTEQYRYHYRERSRR
jgi:ribosomal protein S18 acetylase RimI-like enzyme